MPSPLSHVLESMKMRNTPETNAVIKGKPGDVLSLETRLIEKCADLECERDELLAALKELLRLDSRGLPCYDGWKQHWVNAVENANNVVAKCETK